MNRMLVISPNQTLAAALPAVTGQQKAWDVRTTWQTRETMHTLYEWRPHLVILDIDRVDEEHAWAIYHRIQEVSDIPVLVITTGTDSSERVAALKAGADDAVSRTCEVVEIMLRARNLTPHLGCDGGAITYTYGRWAIDPTTRCLSVDGTVVDLTPAECRLLLCLMGNHDRYVSANELAVALWSETFGAQEKAIKVYIHRLRGKLATYLPGSSDIICRRAIGYRLQSEA